jgi:hypothetical protein
MYTSYDRKKEYVHILPPFGRTKKKLLPMEGIQKEKPWG